MIAENVDKERCIRFYRWAMQDCLREVREDFPYLRRVQSTNSLGYVDFLSSLPAGEQAEMATTLVRRMHRAAVVLLGESFSERELELIRYYFRFSHITDNVIWQKLYGAVLTHKKLSKHQISVQIVKHLTPILGARVRQPISDLVFVTPVGDWFVGTRVTIESPSSINYWQTVMAKEDESVGPYTTLIQNSTNICTWLGASAGIVKWYITSEEEIEPTAESLALLCGHYLKNISSVLNELVPESTSSSDWFRKLTLPANLDEV